MLCTPALAQDYRVPVDWELGLECGLDLRRVYDDNEDNVAPSTSLLRDGLRQNLLSPFLAVSAMRRIAGLRALWGLRIEGHVGSIAMSWDDTDYEVDHRTANVMLAYRFFPLDLQGDCDCPTWGSDPWLKKALFLEAGFGLGYQVYTSASPASEAAPDRSSWGLGYAARVGVSHRVSKAVDVFAALGIHGIAARENGTHGDAAALRPALGLTYRPRG